MKTWHELTKYLHQQAHMPWQKADKQPHTVNAHRHKCTLFSSETPLPESRQDETRRDWEIGRHAHQLSVSDANRHLVTVPETSTCHCWGHLKLEPYCQRWDQRQASRMALSLQLSLSVSLVLSPSLSLSLSSSLSFLLHVHCLKTSEKRSKMIGVSDMEREREKREKLKPQVLLLIWSSSSALLAAYLFSLTWINVFVSLPQR